MSRTRNPKNTAPAAASPPPPVSTRQPRSRKPLAADPAARSPDERVPPLDQPCALLGGLSPQAFMQRHWQRKPLLVRQALPGVAPPLPRNELLALVEHEEVESRLVRRSGQGRGETWQLRRGPMPRRALPSLATPGWTVLVQGLNLHVPAAQALLETFRFVPQARLDDLMVSWASEGGGVGPHFDSYDVFLIQVEGRRRWRIGRMPDARLREGVPLKLIEDFEPEQEWVLEPGDLLYLPPGWAHDGDAVGGACMTCSVGFRAPRRSELARETLLRLADAVDDESELLHPPIYRDPGQPAVVEPGRIPAGLQAYADEALRRALAEPEALSRALGEYLSEPKAQVRFEPSGELLPEGAGVCLDPRTCLLYDDRHVYCNGESWRAAGADARALRQLADARGLDASVLRRASPVLRELLTQWVEDGWLRVV